MSIERCLWQEVGHCFIVIIVGSVISDSAKCLVDIHGPKVKVIPAMLMVQFPPSTFSSPGTGREGWRAKFNQASLAESQNLLF